MLDLGRPRPPRIVDANGRHIVGRDDVRVDRRIVRQISRRPLASSHDLVRSARPAGTARLRSDRGRGQTPPPGAGLDPAHARGTFGYRPNGDLQAREREAVRLSLVAFRAARRSPRRYRAIGRPIGRDHDRDRASTGRMTSTDRRFRPSPIARICRPLASTTEVPARRLKSSIKVGEARRARRRLAGERLRAGELAGGRAAAMPAGGRRRAYQAAADAASVMPSDSSQRSASMAALQPSAAAVTAWRYRWSWTSPAMKTPSILEPVSSWTTR